MSARRAFLSDTATLSVSTFAAVGLAFFSLPVLTRIYGPEAFGILAAFLVLATLFSYFTTIRAENVIGLPEADEDAIAFSQLLLCLCCAVAVVCSLAGLGVVVLGLGRQVGLPGVTPVLLALASTAIGVSAVLRAAAVRFRMFHTAAVSTLARAIVTFGVALVCGVSWRDQGADSEIIPLAIGLILGQLAGDVTASLVIAVRQPAFFHFTSDWWTRGVAVGRRYWHLISALGVSQLLAAIYTPIAILAITTTLGTADAGLFMLAERVLVAPSILIAAAVGEVFRQRAAAAWASGEDITRLMWSVRLGVALAAAPPYLVIGLAGPYLIGLVFGQEWSPAGEIASILTLVAFLQIVAGSTDRASFVLGLPIYVASWHALRLITEAACAGLLLARLVSLTQYLWILVAARSTIYAIEIVYVHFAAKRASLKRLVGGAPVDVLQS